jgi:hypothetical protein
MTRTITHLYDSYAEAAEALRVLEGAGVRASDISLVGGDRDDRAAGPAAETEPAAEIEGAGGEAATAAAAGASIGTVAGGAAGLLAGIGVLAIPGFGPVVAAGWLIAAITGAGVGAGTGGIIGSLIGAGHREEDAHVLTEAVHRGGTLVSVRVNDADAARVDSLLQTAAPVDLASRAAEYRAEGWEQFAQPGTIDSVGATGIGTPTSDGRLSLLEVERQRLANQTHA